MADRIEGASPRQAAFQQLDQVFGREEQKPRASGKDAFDEIARRSKVPANLLIAMDEAEGGRLSVETAERNAARLSQEMAAGKPLDQAVADLTGDPARAARVVDRAYQIADELYPAAPPPPDAGTDGRVSGAEGVGGLARDALSGAVSGIGGAIEAGGVMADEMLRYGADPAQDRPTIVRGLGRAAGDAVRDGGEAIRNLSTDDYLNKTAGTEPGGELFDPSSWTLGEDPSILGLLSVAAQGGGSMLPIVAMPNAAAGAVFGGLMGGGEGVENGRKFVQDAATTLDEAGQPEIAKLPAYKSMIEGGADHETAVAELTRQAENSAGFRQGMFASLGGAATNRIMRGADGWLGQGGRLTRAVKKASAGGLEEGVQEAAEGAAAKSGINAATGAELNIAEDSFGNFIAGGLAGGGMGAASGALFPGEGGGRPAPQPETPPAPGTTERLALPAPENGGTIFGRPPSTDINPPRPRGLPSPTNGGTIIPPAPAAPMPGDPAPVVQRQRSEPSPLMAPPPAMPETPGVDGSTTGPAAAPVPPLVAGAAAIPSPAPDMPIIAPEAPPVGPIQQIARGLVGALPQPEPEPVQLFPDQKPGGQILLGDESGANENAVFLRETPAGGAVIRIAGREVELTAEAFDKARNQAEINQNREDTDRGDLGGNSVAASLGAAQRPRIALSVEEEFAQMSPEQAAARLELITNAARQRGWNARSSNLRKILEGRVALGGTPNVESSPAPDQPAPVAPAQPVRMDPDMAGGDQGSATGGPDIAGGTVASGSLDAQPDAGRPEGSGTDAVGGVDASADTGKLGIALTAARTAGPTTHTTAKGKVKTGFVLQGVTKAEADAIDPYSFKKDGGIFVNVDRADAYTPPAADNANNQAEMPDNAELSQTAVTPVAAAAADVAPAPSEAQKEAGNYKKGHARWNGLDLSIETAKGQARTGTDPNGREWSVTMPADYGYIRRTEGADGDHVDFYMGPNEASPAVFVIDQFDAETGAFDEHKVMLGFDGVTQARAAYSEAFSDGRAKERFGGVRQMDPAEFKAWVKDGDTKKPVSVGGRRKIGGKDAPAESDAAYTARRKAEAAESRAENDRRLDRISKADPKLTIDRTLPGRQAQGVPMARIRVRRDADGMYMVGWEANTSNAGKSTPMAGEYRTAAEAEAVAVEAMGKWADGILSTKKQLSDVDRKDAQKIRDFLGSTPEPEGAAQPDRKNEPKAQPAAGPLSPEPRGPRRLDWWWTNNRPLRKTALTNAGLDPALSNEASADLLDLTTGEQMEALKLAIFGPEAKAAPAPKSSTKAAPKAQQAQAQTAPVEEPAPAAPKVAQPTPGVLGALSAEKQARAAELKAKLAAKVKGQASSGLDPEYITMGGELVALYVEAGITRFGQMLRDFAESTGLTIGEAQAPMRAAYNHVRDDMDLAGKDVTEFDDATAVMAEVRAAIAEEAAAPVQTDSTANTPASDTIADQPQEGTGNDNGADAGDGGSSTQGDAEAATQGDGSVGEPRSRGGEADQGQSGSGGQDRGAGRRGSGRADGNDQGGSTGGADSQRTGPRNHVIEDGGLTLKGGEKTRARNAIKAIEIVRALEREGRPATAEERAALSLYGGAGVLAPALPNSAGKVRMEDIAADLDRLLTPEERTTIEKTSQYAFYTAEPVLRNMWSLAERLGFTGGQVFEPGMGVGGFAGTMPATVNGQYSGIELDHITAKIAAALYPRHHIKHGDFIQTPMPKDFYDLVIGNPPFSQTKITADPAYPQGFMIHDYFFAKSLDSVRPGGILMFVTSAGTMNKRGSAARDYLADRADLVGAVRLPNTAFAENGTQVTTDIIVLRKRLPGEAEANPAWRESTLTTVPDADGGTVELPVNRYFQENPEMVLGEQGAFDKLLAGRNRIGVRPREGADLGRDLRAALSSFPSNIMSAPSALSMMDGPRDATSGETKTGAYYMKDGQLWQFNGVEGKPVERRGKGEGKSTTGMSAGQYELIQQMLPVRDALRAVYAADLADQDATAARAELNRAYDDFVAKNGPINKVVRSFRRPSGVELEGMRQRAEEDARSAGQPFNRGSFDPTPMIEAKAGLAAIARARKEASQQPGYDEGDFVADDVPDKIVESFPNIDPFRDDPESFRLRAIEKYDSETDTGIKSRVFRENTVKKTVQPKISSPEDALLFLLAETGKVDIDKIAALSGATPQSVRADLKGKVFQNPATGEMETRTKYLSGNVRKKLAEAEAAIANDIRYAENADELRKVLPDPIPRASIAIPLGAHWFDHKLYSTFAKAKGLSLNAEFKRALGQWMVTGDEKSAAARNEWGTEDVPFAEMMRRAMNNKPMRVTRSYKDADGNSVTTVDDEATQAAVDKAAELRAAFNEWLWSDADRADMLEKQYNDVFNAEVAPAYDGAYLTTPGINSEWRWRPHQTAVVARILQSGSTYMAHAVGAGKTSAMIGAGMESRRLGLAQRVWYSVPNHMLIQFATEFQQQYPLANILVAEERNFQGDRRRQFVADAASGEYDAVIITHSAFELIPSSGAAKAAVVESMLSDLREMIQDASDNPRDRAPGQDQATLGALKSIAAQMGIKEEKGEKISTAKKIAQMLEQAEQRLAQMTADTGKDEVFNFDEIGVDMLFVDEAHLYRKLSFATTNGTIKGIDPQGSNMSMDLFIKARSVDRRNPGRGLVLASGTPITNTMAELFTVQRFMQPEALEDRNMSAFDAWAATFGEVASELEQTPDGGYKEVSRFSKFVNTPELSLMVRQVMDVVTTADLEKYVTRPKLRGGKRNLVVVEATPEQKAFQQTLGARMRAIQERKGKPAPGDDIMLNIINDGRLSAIDMRLVDPGATGEGSKLETMIQNVYRRWKDGKTAALHNVAKGGGYEAKPAMRGPSTQIIFSTLGVKPTKLNPAFSVHRHIRSSLIRMGVPEADIIMVSELKSHVARQRAFNDMNEGKRRILIGSKTIFTGVNAQKRLQDLHNLDPLWFPADDEQRNGRGLRQGNMNPELGINDYSTKGTYDATMWQMMARKAGFIEGFYRGDPTMRDMEDLGEASAFEQAKAMTTNDPRILELTEMKTERDKLRRRAGAVETQRARLRSQIRDAGSTVDWYRKNMEPLRELVKQIPDTSGDAFRMTVKGVEMDSRADAGTALIELGEAAKKDGWTLEPTKVGVIGGFPVEMTYQASTDQYSFRVDHGGEKQTDWDWSDDAVGMARRMESALTKPIRVLEFYESDTTRWQKAQADYREQLAGVKEFPDQAKLDALEDQIDALQADIINDAAEAEKAAEKAAQGQTDETGDADPVRESRFTDGETITPAEARKINEAARAELEEIGIANRVRVQVGGEGTAAGTYQRGVIGILRARSGKWRHTLDHEILHALRDPEIWNGEAGIFTRPEWSALARAARADANVRARVEAAYPDLTEAGRTEEMVAEFYADWARGNRESPAGPLTAALNRIRSFFNAVASAMRGEGFQDAATIMRRIADGSMGARGPDGPGNGGGRRAPREQRAAPDTKAFRDWFGQSKVVDADGAPLMVYHGSLAKGLEAFDTSLVTTRGNGDEAGSYFTADPMNASNYTRPSMAQKKADPSLAKVRGQIYSVYLSLQNPLDITDAINGRKKGVSFGDAKRAALTALDRNLHDGIIFKGDGNNPGEYVAFRPEQIKSVDNQGTFSPASPNMREQRNMDAVTAALRDGLSRAGGKGKRGLRAIVSRDAWAKTPEVFQNFLTDAMGRNERFNSLGAVPGYALFKELGKNLSAAQTYLGLKQEMDAERNDLQAEAAKVVDAWTKTGKKNVEANNSLMDLMHETTLAGIDPSKPDDWKHAHASSAARINNSSVASPEDRAFARRVEQEIQDHGDTRARLEAQFNALPAEFQNLYRTIRDEYGALADKTDDAVIENVRIANEMAAKKARLTHKKEIQRITDQGLTGSERDAAVDEADRRLGATEKRARENGAARMASLRAAFETNRLKGPYFPLARFGNYYVTIKDASGAVISFSRFEKVAQQEDAVKAANEEGAAEGWTVTRGVLDSNTNLRGMVDPGFVSEVEGILAATDAGPEAMDAIWQHWLETLPDMSVRKSRIHRKGRAGFNRDAVRAFSSAMFHGAHNLARLKYGLRMGDALEDAKAQAARQPNPERAGFVVKEMELRHKFTMNPTNNPAVTMGTSLAFVWYLGMSPASAIVNISQTTIFGIPILGTQFKKAGISGATKALGKAAADFGRGRGWIEKSANLSADEKAAMQEGYRRGTIDRTQAHDLASVAESGVQYNPGREKAMRAIGFLFHHAERLNREVTFLAAYRLARDDGRDHAAAIEAAADLTWRTHFDYQNTSRPRMMQGDFEKVIFTFRNFQVNAIYRLFRDSYQTFKGATPEERSEARGQLVGITLSMMAHAGIKGVWGFSLLMMMLGFVFPGDDDVEDLLQDALLLEGDSFGTAAWNWTMGLALNGVPGHVTGTSLTERLGMPELWFRSPREGTEGQDLWAHYLAQIAGPVAAIPGQFFAGASMMSDAWGEGNNDNLIRGAEKMVPGFVADAIKPVRFLAYGANSYYGDPLMDVGVLDAVRVALGFTPAELAERYDINAKLKGKERQITGRRSTIQKVIGDAISSGKQIPLSAMDDMRAFNREYPEYPITADTIRSSMGSRARAKERNEFGVSLNSKLNDRVRAEMPTAVYN